MTKKKNGILAITGGIIGILTLVALVLGASDVVARSLAQNGAPERVSYQGYLTDTNGQPISGTVDLEFGLYAAPSGGIPAWGETHNGVAVSNGYFSVLLGSVTSLSAAEFSDPTRYLQVSVNTGGGFTPLPRQQMVSVPYALQAQEAMSAAAAPWSGLTGVPAGFADDVDNEGGDYENVIVVAKSGGDFTSVAAALDATAAAANDNRYLVRVAPGEYNETALLHVRAYVHLKGAGANVTKIMANRTAASVSPDAAVIRLDDLGRVSDLNVINSGASGLSYAIYSVVATRDTIIDQVTAEVNGSGGTGHHALYLNDAEPTIRDSVLRAGGASIVNGAVGIVNGSGPFPQPLITGSHLIGGTNNDPYGKTCADNTGTGFGLQMTNAAPTIRDSYICGGHRAIFAGIAGITRVQGSIIEVSSTAGAYMVETSGSSAVTIANSGVFFVGNSTEPGSSLSCTQSYLANYTDANASCN